DNCKTAVLSHPLGQPAQFNPRYLDFANHYGFKVRACGVRKGNEKGRVENGVKFVKENFLRGLELPPWPALNPAGRHWLDTIANIRIHMTERVSDRFLRSYDNKKNLSHVERGGCVAPLLVLRPSAAPASRPSVSRPL